MRKCVKQYTNLLKIQDYNKNDYQGNKENNNGFRLYFLKGCDSRLLSKLKQQSFLNYVKINPFGNSFMIYDSSDLKNKINEWSQILPWIKPYYAVKCNPIVPILQDIMNGPYGTFDCASKGEIKLVMKQGVPGSKVIYSNPVKEEKDIYYAKKKGVKLTTADSLSELIKIYKIAPQMNVLWRISIVVENPEQMSSIYSDKFGDDIPNTKVAHLRLQLIKQLGLSLNGIHYIVTIDLAQECMKIGRYYGHKMEILDVGGGFSAGTLNKNIIQKLENTKNNELGYQVIAEPGRYFSSNACNLLLRIMTKKTKYGKLCYQLNGSLFHSFHYILTDGVSFENSINQCYDVIDSDETINSNIQSQEDVLFGMTCDGTDIIVKNILMPKDMEVGDWVCMSGMGAYTNSAKSEFNGMKSVTKVYKC